VPAGGMCHMELFAGMQLLCRLTGSPAWLACP
jgi:hypothetical protein